MRDVLLRGSAGDSWQIVAVSSTAPWLRVEQIPSDGTATISNNFATRLRLIALLNTESDGDFHREAEVVINTTHPEMPDVIVPVVATTANARVSP